jgi:hypothetical protein
MVVDEVEYAARKELDRNVEVAGILGPQCQGLLSETMLGYSS